MPRRKAPPISPPREPRALSNNQDAAGRTGPAFHRERGACLRRGRAKEGASERRAHRLPVFRRTNVSRETFFAAIRCDEESAWRELGDRAASVRWGWWDEALCGSAGYDGAGAEGARRQRRVRWGWHVGALGEHSVCDGAGTTGCIAWTWRYAGVLRRGAKTRPRAMRSAAMTCVRLGGAWKGPCGIGTGSPALVIDVRMFHVKHSAAQHATPRIIRARHGSAGRLQQRDTLRKGGARCSAA